jgi:hypothetical protein
MRSFFRKYSQVHLVQFGDIQVDWGVCRVSDHSANVYGVALGCVGFVDSTW